MKRRFGIAVLLVAALILAPAATGGIDPLAASPAPCDPVDAWWAGGAWSIVQTSGPPDEHRYHPTPYRPWYHGPDPAGRGGMLAVHPVDPSTPAIVRWTGSIPSPASDFVIDVAGSIHGDFRLVVSVNGTEILDETVDGQRWHRFTASLASWAGQSVTIDVRNHPGGTRDYFFETCFIDAICLAGVTPVVTSVTPRYGPIEGGTRVTIAGSDFVAGTAVTFGGISAAAQVDSATTIVATVPPGAGESVVDVVVTPPSGGSATLASAYTYAKVLTLAHFAGQITGEPGRRDGRGTDARFEYPRNPVADRDGNLFVVDNGGIRRVAPDGTVTTVTTSNVVSDAKLAPDGTVLISSGVALDRMTADGVRTRLRTFTTAFSRLAVAPSGIVYLGRISAAGAFIHRLNADGTTSLVAGSPTQTGTTDGPGLQARFGSNIYIDADADGSLWVSDVANSTIRRVDPSGNVATVAGVAGQRGFEDGTGAAARFQRLSWLATDPTTGDAIVVDDLRIRRVTRQGAVTTVAGQGGWGGGVDGPASTARFGRTLSITVSPQGEIVIADFLAAAIRRITNGVVATIAGARIEGDAKDGPGERARFYLPESIASGPDGSFYVTDTSNFTVRKVSPGGLVTTLAGRPGVSGHLDGPAGAALFASPYGITVDRDGSVYVGDLGSSTIRRIAAGSVSTVAGSPGNRGYQDGPGSQALVGSVYGLTSDASGNVYLIDDSSSFRGIRRLAADGNVTTVAGGAPASSQFGFPLYGSLVHDGPAERLLVADPSALKIWSIDLRTNAISHFAGAALDFVAKDGPRLQAEFQSPEGIARHPDGSIYVADGGSVRRISGDLVTTVAGRALGNSGGTGADIRLFYAPDLAFNARGEAFVLDQLNSVIFGPTCALPGAVANVALTNASSPGAPFSAVDSLRLSWQPPAAGSPPHSYEYRVNGGAWTSAPQSPVILSPRGSADPLTVAVRAYGCAPTVGPSAEASSVSYSLAAPAASFSASRTSINVGETVTFTDTSSPQATAWLWFFGDGGFSTAQNPQRTFTTSGTYGVQLVAMNGSGISVSPVQLVVVNPPGSAAAPGASASRRQLQVSSSYARDVYLRLLDGNRLVAERRLALGEEGCTTVDPSAYTPASPSALRHEVVGDRVQVVELP